MNNKSQNLGYVLNFAAVVMFIAVLGMIFTNSNISSEMQFLFFTLYAIVNFIMSFIIKINLKLEVSEKWFYGIGFISFLIGFILFSNSQMMLDLFKQNGFIYIYLSMISLIIGIFFIITSFIYKNFNLLKITYLSGFFIICFLLKYYNFNLFYILIIIDLITLLINIFAYKKTIYSVSKMLSYILPCITLFMENVAILNFVLFTLINFLNIITILYHNKDLESNLLSLIVLMINYLMLDYSLYQTFALNYSMPIIISLHLSLLLIIEFSNIIDKKILLNIFKVLNYSLVIIAIIITIKERNDVCLVISSLFLITLITNRIIFKDKKINHYCLPIGILVEMIAILSFINFNYFHLSTSLCLFIINIILLILYKFNKDYHLKIIYSLLIGLLLCDLVFINPNGILNYMINLGVLLIDYIFITTLDDKTNSIIDYIFYTLLLGCSLLQLFNIDLNHVKYLIISFLYLILLYKNKDNKFKCGITIIALFFSIILYIKGATSVYWLTEILIATKAIILSFIYKYLILENKDEKMIFLTIMIDLILLNLLPNRDYLFICLYIFFISVLMIIYSIKHENDKLMLISGIIFLFLSILSLLNNLSTLPIFIYLFLISIVIMIIIIYLLKNQDKQENMLCSKCQNKIDKDDIFCSNCGNKLK